MRSKTLLFRNCWKIRCSGAGALKKTAGLDIQTICPLHGPVLNENPDFYLNLYQTWSAYEPEDKGVLIAYTSVYGNTKKAAESLAQMLVDKGCEKVAITDLARDDIAEAVKMHSAMTASYWQQQPTMGMSSHLCESSLNH